MGVLLKFSGNTVFDCALYRVDVFAGGKARAVAKAAAGTEGGLLVEDLIRAALRSLF